MATTVGARGEYDCSRCDDTLKQERGGCPFVEGATLGTSPAVIDYTGDDEHDLLFVCPMGVQLSEPALLMDVRLWHKISGLGGPAAFYGPGLGRLPARVSQSLSLFQAVEQRFIAEIKRTRLHMDRRS